MNEESNMRPVTGLKYQLLEHYACLRRLRTDILFLKVLSLQYIFIKLELRNKFQSILILKNIQNEKPNMNTEL